MGNSLKLTVITIVYNDLAGLVRTCNSIEAQTYKSFEHIVIDGGSNDGADEFLSSRTTTLSNYDFISEPDSGIYNAMNKGIKLSSGEWVIFINAGDEIVSETTFERALNLPYFDTTDYDVIYGHKVNKFNELIRSQSTPECLKNGEFFACHQSMFFRDKTLYDESYKIFGDFELLARLFVSNGISKFKQIDLPIAIFEGGGVSSKVTRLKRIEKFKAIYTNFGLLGILNNYIFNRDFWNKLFKRS